MNVLRIGIATRAQMKARTLAIARGEAKARKDDPKVWFTSIESVAQVLSTRNKVLLEIIRRAKPSSLAELARLSGRAQSNLSRTLRTMARYGLVVLTHTNGRLTVSAPCDAFLVDVPLVEAA